MFAKGQWNVSSFLTAYLGIPIFLALYFRHKIANGRQDYRCRVAKIMDLITGLDEMIAEEFPEPPSKWK